MINARGGSTVKTVELGRTGERISALALGAMNMGTTTDEESANHMLDRFVDLGGTHIDTANCYAWFNYRGATGAESEELLGRWFARTRKRDQVFLATKGSGMVTDVDAPWEDGGIRWDTMDRFYEGAGAQTLKNALDTSLRRMGVDHIDLYYVHVDDRRTPLEETLAALAGFVESGKVRHLGWSNVRTWRLERIRQLCEQHGWPKPVAIQQAHSYLRPNPGVDTASIVDFEQLDYLRNNTDVTLVAYSPILKGIYDNAQRRAEHWVMGEYGSADSEARLAAVTEVAGEIGATPNQTVLAWMLHQTDPVRVPLIGPRTVEQFEDLVPAADLKLTGEQLHKLDVAGA
jgi:aryl-alcohol dehydrogenase-like predicted oxidoreductase